MQTTNRDPICFEEKDYHADAIASVVEVRLLGFNLYELVGKLGNDERLMMVWDLIRQEYRDPSLNLRKASQTAGVHAAYLNVLLRQRVSFTFHQILIRYRLLMAVREGMARNTKLNVLDLALDVGFGSLSAFERNFRSLMGLIPSTFFARIED